MKRLTKRTLKNCCIIEKKGRKNTRQWSNALTRNIDPDDALAAMIDLVRSRAPFPIALYKVAKRSARRPEKFFENLNSCGYYIPFYVGQDNNYVFGINPDPDGPTNIATTEQIMDSSNTTPPLGLYHHLA